MTQEALKLALEFIENSECGTADLEARIKEALAQTQEPVAWISPKGHIHFDPYLDSVPLYTAPPQRTEQNFCSRCGKRTTDLTTIHTCTPPQEKK